MQHSTIEFDSSLNKTTFYHWVQLFSKNHFKRPFEKLSENFCIWPYSYHYECKIKKFTILTEKFLDMWFQKLSPPLTLLKCNTSAIPHLHINPILMSPEISIAQLCPHVTHYYLLNTDSLGASKRRKQKAILPVQILTEDSSCPY